MIPRKLLTTSARSRSTLIWTIGSGGLIGSAINHLSGHAFNAKSISWSQPDQAISDLDSNLRVFVNQAADYFGWAIIWAAGSATTASSPRQASLELEVFSAFITLLADEHPPVTGEFVLISSAGGVYAGSTNPPFTEETEPRPIGTYGQLKLDQELQAIHALGSSDRDEAMPAIRVTICRVSNAYGPGQNLTKLQGLISRLAISTLQRDPVNLFVPLATVRDFIFTTDIARRVHALLQHTCTDNHAVRIRIIASEQPTSLGQLVRLCQSVFHRRIPIAMGTHPSSQAQVSDLRFRSRYEDSRSAESPTQLPIGIKAVFDDIAQRVAQGK